MSIPVYIIENGIPVRAVASGHPLMTVTDNLGIPIRLDDYGLPFVVEGVGPDPEIPIKDQSTVYIDNGTAPAGNVATLTSEGLQPLTFTDAAGPAGSAINVMEADGLKLNGNTLRWTGTAIAANKITILAEITRQTPLSGVAQIVSINPTAPTGERFALQYRAVGPQATGPNATVLSHAPIGGLGVRQVIGVELDAVAGTMTVIDADGETKSTALTVAPFGVSRIDIGTASVGILHRLAVVIE